MRDILTEMYGQLDDASVTDTETIDADRKDRKMRRWNEASVVGSGLR